MDDSILHYFNNCVLRLKKLRRGEIDTKNYEGLCSVINFDDVELEELGFNRRQIDQINNAIYEIFSIWSEFSGSLTFPVRSPSNKAAWSEYCEVAIEEDNFLYNRNTEYGRARWRLCDHMITELEKFLDSRDYSA